MLRGEVVASPCASISRWTCRQRPLGAVPAARRRHHHLDVALSDRDHGDNTDMERALELRLAAGAPVDTARRSSKPTDIVEYLRWFIDNDEPPTGSGPNGLADFCQQATTYWERRDAPNVHLFHY